MASSSIMHWHRHEVQKKLLLYCLAVLISIGVGVFSFNRLFDHMNWLLYDQIQGFNQLPEAQDIIIVEIDDKSIAELGRWPWVRATHGKLIDRLVDSNARLIVFDVLFPNADLDNPASDQYFTQSIEKSRRTILPIYHESIGNRAMPIESPPYSLFYEAALTLGHIHLQSDSDGIVRSLYLKEGVGQAFWPHLSLAAALELKPQTNLTGSTLTDSATEESSLTIARDYFNLIPMPAKDQGIRHFSYSDVLNNRIAPSLLENKVVFIGATATGLGDVLTTSVGRMPGVELNAWIYQAISHEQLVEEVPVFYTALINSFFSLLLLLILGRLSPKSFLLLSLVGLIAIILLSAALLLFFSLWLRPAAALAGLVCFFPLWSWLRAESVLLYLTRELNHLSGIAETSLPKYESFSRTLLNSSELDKRALSAKSRGLDLIDRTINQLNQMKAQDKQARTLIEQSLNSIQDAVLICDTNGQVLYFNQCFKGWFPDAKNLSVPEAFTEFELKNGQLWQALLTEAERQATPTISECTNQQSTYLVQAGKIQVWQDKEDTIILSLTDITALREAENARAEALSFLSHDLRSPMVSVLSILEKSKLQGDAISSQELVHIETLVKKNIDYAERFLELSKADNLNPEDLMPVDLHAVIDAAQAHAIALAVTKNIKVIVERCDEDCWSVGDQSLLERAVINLISNAVKFSTAGSCICLKLKKEEQYAVILVEDEGEGISVEDQAKLFERFVRASNSANSHGTGLGLNFVRTVAHKLGGGVYLESSIGQGATFTIKLPTQKEEDLFDFE